MTSSSLPASPTPRTDAPALEVRGLSKAFRAVDALRDVSFSVHRGEVVALLGDNGAGKSTLVKCVSGLHTPDAGVILIDGEVASISTPDEARAIGIETVYQGLALIDTLDVVDNLFLNREIVRGPRGLRWLGWLESGQMRNEARATLSRLDIRIPSLETEVGMLSGGQRQAVAIGRAAAWGRHIVMLDEPAAALGVEQAARVMDLVRSLAQQGVAVLFITHDMTRVLEVCHRAVVLRQGRLVANVEVDGSSGDDLVAYITGTRTAFEADEVNRE